jgi:hypothetical protein
VKSGRNSLALGIGALAIVALAGMGFALHQFAGGASSVTQSTLRPPSGAPATAAEPQNSPAAPANTPSSEPAAAAAMDKPTSAQGASVDSPAAQPSDSKPADPQPAESKRAESKPVDTGAVRRDATRQAQAAAAAARASVPPGGERPSGPPPSPPAAPPAPQLAENPTVLVRCDGAAEVCAAVRDAFASALQRERMAVTTSAPRADVYIVVNAAALDGAVQEQFGTTFVVRNYAIAVELEAPRFDEGPPAPQGRTFSADLRVGKERVNENARLVAIDTVAKIREFWTRRRSQGN